MKHKIKLFFVITVEENRTFVITSFQIYDFNFINSLVLLNDKKKRNKNINVQGTKVRKKLFVRYSLRSCLKQLFILRVKFL